MESWTAYWIGVSQNWVAGIIAVAAMAAFKSWKNKKWAAIKIADVKSVYSGLMGLALLNVLLAVALTVLSACMVLFVPSETPPSRADVVSIAFFSALFVKFLDDIFNSSIMLYRVYKQHYNDAENL